MLDSTDQIATKPKWHENSWFKAAELIGILLAILAIGYDVIQRERIDRPVAEATLKELQNAEITRSIALLESSTASQRRKVRALNDLARLGAELNGLDFSCSTFEVRTYLKKSLQCSAIRGISGLNLVYKDDEISHEQVTLSDLGISNSEIEGFRCSTCDLRGLRLVQSNIKTSRLSMSDLTSAYISPADHADLTLWQSNMSGAVLDERLLVDFRVNGAWYWSDDPPRIIAMPTRLAEGEGSVSQGLIGILTPTEVPIDDQRALQLGMRICDSEQRSSNRGAPWFIPPSTGCTPMTLPPAPTGSE